MLLFTQFKLAARANSQNSMTYAHPLIRPAIKIVKIQAPALSFVAIGRNPPGISDESGSIPAESSLLLDPPVEFVNGPPTVSSSVTCTTSSADIC